MKNILPLLILIFVCTSCSNPQIEKDAKHLAELTCRSQKLIMKAQKSDQTIVEESQKISAEAAKLFSEMQGKYRADSEQEQFVQAYNDELEKCK
jgi:hypothetical protein